MSETADDRSDGYRFVARTEEIPAGTMKCFDIAGNDVLVCHTGGTFYAVKNLCTHAESKLDGGRVRANWISCPAHGARFDLATGKSLGGVGYRPIATYPLKLDGDGIFVLV